MGRKARAFLHAWVAALALAGAAAPLSAQVGPEADALASGLDGALLGCEAWVLDPASWATEAGIGPFLAVTGLDNRIAMVPGVIDAALPPAELRVANRYFRINATLTAGYVLVVSDRLPICHVTGGGGVDLQPVVEGLLASPAFQARWQAVDDMSQDGMHSTLYRSRRDPALAMVLSRAAAPGGHTDVVQVVATAQYEYAGEDPG